jgi:flagellar hook assembly protein FlgD
VALALPHDGVARVVLYDLGGRAVRTLFDGWESAGTHMLAWDGRTSDGTPAPIGLYFIRAESEGQSVTRAIVRVR